MSELDKIIAAHKQRERERLNRLLASEGSIRQAPRMDAMGSTPKKKKVDDPRTAPPPYGSWTPEGELLAEEQGLIPPSDEPMGEGHEETPMTLDDEIEADTPNPLKPRTSNDKRLE